MIFKARGAFVSLAFIVYENISHRRHTWWFKSPKTTF